MMRERLAYLIDRKHDPNYPQLWYFMPRIKKWPRLRRFLQYLCGLVGHELSKTEWGYGGGDYADRWCRWCDKMFVVPKESIFFAFPHAKEMTKIVGKEFSEDELPYKF